MKNRKYTQEKTKHDLAEIIRSQLSFTNGWWIDEKSYQEHCDKAALRIIKLMRRRKVLKNVAP